MQCRHNLHGTFIKIDKVVDRMESLARYPRTTMGSGRCLFLYSYLSGLALLLIIMMDVLDTKGPIAFFATDKVGILT